MNKTEQKIQIFFDYIMYGKLVEFGIFCNIWQIQLGWVVIRGF